MTGSAFANASSESLSAAALLASASACTALGTRGYWAMAVEVKVETSAIREVSFISFVHRPPARVRRPPDHDHSQRVDQRRRRSDFREVAIEPADERAGHAHAERRGKPPHIVSDTGAGRPDSRGEKF